MHLFMIALTIFTWGPNWIYRYNGPGDSTDCAYSIVYGADGNIYAAGASCGDDQDLIVVSLTNTGDTNWVYRYDGPGSSWDVASSVAYGTDSNVYVAGLSCDLSTYFKFIVISINPDGDTNWVYQYAEADGKANSIAFGANGNIYAAGYVQDTTTHRDVAVISLTNSGDTNWVYRYNGPGNYIDEIFSIVYGTDNNIYAAGWSGDINSDLIVISLTTGGDTNWVYRYAGQGASWANSVIYGTDNNIYVAGVCQGDGINDDFIVISLMTNGDTNWVYTYNGTGNQVDCANSIIFGEDGNIYAAGESDGYGYSSGDFIVVSLTPSGDTNWIYLYDDAFDYAESIVYGNNGYIYAAGWTLNLSLGVDWLVIRLTTAGDSAVVYRYNGPGDHDDFAASLVYGLDANIYVAGYSHGGLGSLYDFTVISLPPDLGVQEEKKIVRNCDFGCTIFSGPLHLSAVQKYKIFDVAGREIRTLDPAPGIYFVEVEGKIRRKVVKIR